MGCFCFGLEKAINFNKYTICGIEIGIFYYRIDKNTTELYKYTPNNNNLMEISYEGIYHPVCKINLVGYTDLSINEDGILNKGKIEIYNYKTQYGKDILDAPMLIGLLVCGLHSISLRLNTDVKRIANGLIVDKIHIKAAKYTLSFIIHHIQLLKIIEEEPLTTCILYSLNKKFINSNDILNIYNLIEKNETKEKIIKEYFNKSKINIPIKISPKSQRKINL
jgi:hypothetical protein